MHQTTTTTTISVLLTLEIEKMGSIFHEAFPYMGLAYVELPDLSLSALQDHFREELETLYKRYEQRFQIGTFQVYLLFQTILCLAYITSTVVKCSLQEDGGCSALDVPPELPSILGFSVILALSVVMMLITYNDGLFKERPWVLCGLSAVMAFSIEAVDVGLVVYDSTFGAHNSTTKSNTIRPYVLRSQEYVPYATSVPILSIYNHLIIYLFLPIHRQLVAVALGSLATLISLSLFVAIEFSHQESEDMERMNQLFLQFGADLVFFLSLNLIGFYVKYVSEINMRRGFLDKRSCIETTFKLKYEKEQEENLLLSILPKHIARQVRDTIWSHIEKKDKGAPFSELFVGRHENISILFADICKFTQLTTTLSVDKLVETLNDLFGKFDDAAELHKCMRIKILGDCYYCVAGMPNPDPMHAINCVKMGLTMIEMIQDVKHEHHVDVNMRIGIHSGYIFSGLIGARKWQFDIWSQDVTIANHMESAGKAGAVHVTESTKASLGDYFNCDPVAKDEIDDEILSGNQLNTYLIWPYKNEYNIGEASRNNVNTPDSTESKRRRSVLMDTSVKNFQRLLNSTGEFMRDEIENLPLKQQDQWLHPDQITPLCLFFKDMSRELPYLRENDLLYKFYILGAYIVLVAMGIILLLTETHFNTELWFEYTLLFVILTLLLPCFWVTFIWEEIIDPHYESESIPLPEHRILRFFYSISGRITQNLAIRNLIYIVISGLFITSAVRDVITAKPCALEHPKNYTYRCTLAMIVIFMFLRIHHWLKTIICLVCIIFYYLVINGYIGHPDKEDNIFENEYFGFQEVISVDHKSTSHIIFLLVVGCYFWLVDRQHEYMRRLDFQWKGQLNSEQFQAKYTKEVNRVLLENILPKHVADHYLSSNRETGDLYCESYEKVAVLFASIPGFMQTFIDDSVGVGEECLEKLNLIISSFDRLLFDDQFSRVEKIKVISSTYMAACGLQPGRKSSLEAQSQPPPPASPTSAGSFPGSCSLFDKDDNAKVMAEFAAAMMRAIKGYSDAEHNLQLRIGFNIGPVIAGVVGAQKPLYDIWGDTVNVASRMDSNGVKGRIQVTEDTAKCLKDQKIHCSFRDTIPVKGKGQMPVYFVDLTDDLYISKEEEYGFADTSTTIVIKLTVTEAGRFTVTPSTSRKKRHTQPTDTVQQQPLEEANTSPHESSNDSDHYEAEVIEVKAQLHKDDDTNCNMETFIPEVETNEETPIEEEARPYEIIDVQTSFSEEEQVLSLIDIALANEGDDVDVVDILDHQDEDTDVENEPPSPTFSEITLTENIDRVSDEENVPPTHNKDDKVDNTQPLCSNNNSSDENNMNHSSSKVEGLYTRMPTPVEKQQSKSASGSASAGLSSSSHSIIFRQKKKDSGYGSQGHLKLELINSISSHAATNDEDDLEDLPVEGTLPQVDDETAFRYYEYLVLGGESEEEHCASSCHSSGSSGSGSLEKQPQKGDKGNASTTTEDAPPASDEDDGDVLPNIDERYRPSPPPTSHM